MQQRLSITALAKCLQMDPFYGDNRWAFEMTMAVRQTLLEPPMTFPFIGSEKVDGPTARSLNISRPWQSELLHTWCGLERLDTYEPHHQTPTGWFCWDYHDHCHMDLEIDRDGLKKFLRNKTLPLPAFWFPEAPDNSKKWKRLAPATRPQNWPDLVLLGQLEDEIESWEGTTAANVTERLEKERRIAGLQKQRAAVWKWLNQPESRQSDTNVIEKLRADSVWPREKQSESEASCKFKKEGDFWCISFAGRKAPPLKNGLGFQYVACLLSNPQRDIHVAELSHLINGHLLGHHSNNQKGRNGMESRLICEDGLTLSKTETSEPVLDAKAKAEFKSHITLLSNELEQARQYNDIPRIAALEAEKEAVENELKKAVGLGGKNRKIGKSMHEKIRKAVTNRIHDAIKTISKNHHALGQHLANSIHTGIFCSYCPEKPVSWHL